MNQAADTALAAAAPAGTSLGEPRGLVTLFMTEMWERFTFYGMRAVLILFMVAAVKNGGLGFDDRTASAVYGLYLGGTYLLGLFGGWVADRLLGAQRAVLSGGLLITLGNAMLALGNTPVFFLGLLVIVMGVGLLKPNVSAMVAALYPEGGSRRDAGFSFFYMGINLGALLGSTLLPLPAAWPGWRWGFGLPALGMGFGLAQFLWTRHYLGAAGLAAAEGKRGSWTPVIVFLALLAGVALALLSGLLRIDAVVLADSSSWAMLALGVAYFLYLLFFAGLTAIERNRALVMVALVGASVMFWAGYEQARASSNLFADRYTDRHVLGWEMPAGVLQGVNSLFIIVFAPLFAALWISLGKRRRDFNPAAEFGAGPLLLGLGFIGMYFASHDRPAGDTGWPPWLGLTYLLHSFAELCLSPVGLSYMTKLAPPRFVGQAMGMRFLSLALGSNLAGQLTGQYAATKLDAPPGQVLQRFWYGAIGGAVMLLLTPFVKRMMAGVK